MNTITLNGKEYILRCDINVLEKLHKAYDTIDIPASDITAIKEVAAMMINEHFRFVGSQEVVTPDYIGMHLKFPDYKKLLEAMTAELRDCITSKN